MSVPMIIFDNVELKYKTSDILKNLPEYDQIDFFNEEIQNSLIKALNLQAPGWSLLIQQIWKNIREHGFTVVRNLPFDENNRLSVALACKIGKPIPHNNKIKEVVREIVPRKGARPLENYPHTDSPHWIKPNDMITLECKIEDQHIDVYSRIVPIWEVEKEIAQNDIELHSRLFNVKYPFILIEDDGPGGYQMQPVLQQVREGGKDVTHVRFCLTDSITVTEKFGFDDQCLEDLRRVERMVDQIGERTQFLFKKGDWLLFDNKRTFHSKTKTSPSTLRTLKKMKLQIDRSRIYAN